MAKSKQYVRPFAALADADLADMIGGLDVQARAIAEQMKAAKDEFARRRLVEVRGSIWAVLRSDVIRQVVDIGALREALPQIAAQFMKSSISQKYTIKASTELVREEASTAG